MVVKTRSYWLYFILMIIFPQSKKTNIYIHDRSTCSIHTEDMRLISLVYRDIFYKLCLVVSTIIHVQFLEQIDKHYLFLELGNCAYSCILNASNGASQLYIHRDVLIFLTVALTVYG